MKITISVDNTADLGPELLAKHNIIPVYTGAVIGDKFYLDKDLTPEDIYKSMEVDNVVPKTSACLETDYREIFEEATKDGGAAIHISMSSNISASYENAKRAAKDFANVYVVDSKSLTLGIGILAIKASEFRAQGMDVREIVEKITDLRDRVDLSLIINDLKFLHKGGRVSGLKLLGANLLKIRPSLEIDNEGKLVPAKKFKGDFARCVQEWTQYKLSQNTNVNKDLVFVAHTEIDPKIPAQIVADLKKAGFKEIIQLYVGVSITIHAGRNTIGMIIINE
ncbi:MAG: DegV family protein [Firmicutes bacterium]|nr:DegV family protein [Bacillota bacterium]